MKVLTLALVLMVAACPKPGGGGSTGGGTGPMGADPSRGGTGPTGGGGATSELQLDLDKAQREMQEGCHSQTKIVMDWSAFDAIATDAACDNNAHPSISQICVTAANAVDHACRAAYGGAGDPKTRELDKQRFGALTELHCTIDSKHEQAVRTWMTAHPDWIANKQKGLTQPQCYRDGDTGYSAEVWSDMGGHRYGQFSMDGTMLTFRFTHEAGDPLMYLWDQLK